METKGWLVLPGMVRGIDNMVEFLDIIVGRSFYQLIGLLNLQHSDLTYSKIYIQAHDCRLKLLPAEAVRIGSLYAQTDKSVLSGCKTIAFKRWWFTLS